MPNKLITPKEFERDLRKVALKNAKKYNLKNPQSFADMMVALLMGNAPVLRDTPNRRRRKCLKVK